MWPHISYFEPVGKMGALTYRLPDDPEACIRVGPQPGDYALREAPTVIGERYPLMEVPELFSAVDDVAIAMDLDSSPVELSTDAVFQVWHFLYGRIFARPKAPTKSFLSKTIESIVGSRRQLRPFYDATELGRGISHCLWREYFSAQLQDFVHNRLQIKQRLAATRERFLQYIGRPVTETGSSAAIAKRINPLGAPPQIA